jgi:hypothetical protein
MTEEIIEAPVLRDEKGRLLKGVVLNRNGRPKLAKNKNSKMRMESMLNSIGPKALKELQVQAAKCLKAGDVNSFIKINMFLVGEWFTVTLHNEKLEMTKMKEKNAKRAKEQEMDVETRTIVFSEAIVG